MDNKQRQEYEFEKFFDNLITYGRIVKEKTIVPGLKIKLRPLDVDEQISAESISIASNPGMPIDTVEKIRAINTLSRAILEVNGVKVVEDDDNTEAKIKKSEALYRKLLSLPSHVIDLIYIFYAECVNEQREMYKSGLQENIENF